jgi:hypothetical protein
MKLISRIVAIFMLCAAAPLFGVSLVAHTSAVASNVQTATATLNATGANFIVVAVSSAPVSGTVTDSNKNTWTALTQYGVSGQGVGIRLFYVYNPVVNSGQTFTFSDVAAVYPSIAVAAFSGVAASPFDAQNGSFVVAGAGTHQTGSISPSADGELLISATGNSSTSADTIDSSFTVIEHQNYSAGFGLSLAYLAQTTAAPVNPAWTIPQQHSPVYDAFTIASFKTVQGGGVQVISGGTVSLGTAAVPSGACAPAVTSNASGVAANDTIIYNTNTDPTVVQGYRPSASGSLYIWAFPSANNVSFVVCNPSAASINPGALSLNWKVMR